MIESDYAREIVALVDAGRKALRPLLQALPDILSAAAKERSDSAGLPRRNVAGIVVAIECPAGSTREWTDSDGTTGSTVMRWDYGYVVGAIGADGEEVDVYVGPDPEPAAAFVVHQNSKADGFKSYDEDKVMLGWSSAVDAVKAYLDQYDDPRFFGGMSRIPIAEFRERLRSASGERLGSAGSWRQDDASDRLRSFLAHGRDAVAKTLDTSSLERLARRQAFATTAFQKQQLARQTRAALGVDVVTLDKKVPAMIDHFVGENVTLIRSLGDRALADVAKLATRAVTSGLAADDVAEEIAARYGVHERHARLIARDQIGKLTGQVNAARQREIGIASFVWRTAGDERVRPEHEELEGQTFAYDDPPSEGLPGEPILCRCSAEPVFDGVLDDEDGSSDDTDEADDDPQDQSDGE